LPLVSGSFAETLHIENKAIQNSIPLFSIFDFQENLSLPIWQHILSTYPPPVGTYTPP